MVWMCFSGDDSDQMSAEQRQRIQAMRAKAKAAAAGSDKQAWQSLEGRRLFAGVNTEDYLFI